jgi:phosphoglycolate phosphatase-like HAD superfamily hydrolase
MWDIDRTLLRANSVTTAAYAVAFTAATGLNYGQPALDLAGRTDVAIAQQAFAAHGIADPTPYLDRFFDLFAAECAARRDLLSTGGELMPGIAELIPALADQPGIVQTVVTGNIPAVARIKLDAFGLTGWLDTEVGGYGHNDAVRAALVRQCLARSADRYGPFADAVVIGDTRHDVEAALASGVTVVGVGTGPLDAAGLLAAGAHHAVESFAVVPAAVALLTSAGLTGNGPIREASPIDR